MVGGGVKHSETKGIRGSEAEQTIPQSRSACQLPLHKGAKVWLMWCRTRLHASPYGGAHPPSCLPLWRCAPAFMPPLMVRGVSRSDGGDKKVRYRYNKSKTEQTIPQSAYGSQLPLHKGGKGRQFPCIWERRYRSPFPEKSRGGGRERAVYKSPPREGLFLCCRGTDFVDF